MTGQSTTQQFSQTELNDLVRDFGLFKKAAEIFASRLQEKHLLNNSAKVLNFRNHDQFFAFRTKAVCLLPRHIGSTQAIRCCFTQSS